MAAEEEGNGAAQMAPSNGGPRSEVDVEQLAGKIYRLIKEELRLERARGQQPSRRRRR